MLNRRLLFLVFTLLSVFLVSTTAAVPVHKGEIEHHCAPTVKVSLSEYYENIVDQVMETIFESIITSVPHSYMAARHYLIRDHGKFI